MPPKKDKPYIPDLTPLAVALQGVEAAWDVLVTNNQDTPQRVLDPNAGAGIFGQAVRHLIPDAFTVGVELRASEAPFVERNYDVGLCPFDFADFENLSADDEPYDLIVTNPDFPFADYIHGRARSLLKPGGVLCLYQLSTWGHSAAGAQLFREWAPFSQARVTGRVKHRTGINPENGKPFGVDMRDVSFWCFVHGSGEGLQFPRWITYQLPLLPKEDREWATRPGEEPLCI